LSLAVVTSRASRSPARPEVSSLVHRPAPAARLLPVPFDNPQIHCENR